MYDFVDYEPALHRALDGWRGGEIARFAMDGSIGEEWRYYLDSKEYRAGVDVFCKVALLDGRAVAVMIVFCHPDYPVGVNPIIVAPELAGQGHGSAVLREFFGNIGEILPAHSDRAEVVIDKGNVASVRVFVKAGFLPLREHPDGDVVYYGRALG